MTDNEAGEKMKDIELRLLCALLALAFYTALCITATRQNKLEERVKALETQLAKP